MARDEAGRQRAVQPPSSTQEEPLNRIVPELHRLSSGKVDKLTLARGPAAAGGAVPG